MCTIYIVTSHCYFPYRGWGLRCLDDIPAGGFVCVYAGQILSEQGANEVSLFKEKILVLCWGRHERNYVMK